MANTKFQNVLDMMSESVTEMSSTVQSSAEASADVTDVYAKQETEPSTEEAVIPETARMSEEFGTMGTEDVQAGSEMPVQESSVNPNESDSVMESIKLQLSDGLESYYIAQANGGFVSSQMISRLYIMSQFVDGEIDGATLNQQMKDVKNNLYNDMDAQAWIVSFTRENNPYHYEPVVTGKEYGSNTGVPDASDMTVDVNALDINTALTPVQLDMINKLNQQGENSLSEEEKTMIFAQLVSDNYQKNNDVTDLCDGDITKLPVDVFDNATGNLVIDDGQGVMLDVSEMTVGRKTRLDGEFKTTDIDGETAEEHLKKLYQEKKEAGEDVSDGVSIEVCGGTLTYSGQFDVYHFSSSYMGEFNYRSSIFTLGYQTDTVTTDTETGEQNEIAVPTLHMNDDFKPREKGTSDFFDAALTTNAITDALGGGYETLIPDGLKVGDYMFQDSSTLTKMPVLPDSLESAHSMFSGCGNMTRACRDAKTGEYGDEWYQTGWLGGDVGSGGTLKAMPANLQDVSYMFADCTKLEDTFDTMGTAVWDARGMYQACPEQEKMIDMSNCKYLLTEMAADIYTGCNSDLQDKIEETMAANGMNVSQWTGSGAMANTSDRIINGVDVASQQSAVWQRMVDAKELIENQDPSGGGAVTGSAALSAGLVGYGVQHTEDGRILVDDSTWSSLRDNYDEPETVGGSDFMDRGLAFLGTMGISSAVLSGVTKSKWIGLIGGAAIAAVPQVVGFGNKISPLLRTVGNMIGEDNAFGKGLNSLADKLEGAASTDNVRDVLGVEELFDDRQTDTKKYSEAILQTLTNTEENSKVGAGFYMQQIDTMKENGRLLAQDGNLDVIAYTSEEEFANCCNSAVMSTACDGMMEHVNSLAAGNEGGQLTAEQKEAVGNSFVVMMQNINAYSNGAMSEMGNSSDPEVYERQKAGLGKVMRNTTEPVYSLICQVDAKYQVLTEEQKQMLDALCPEGTTTFSEYQESYNPETRVGDIGTPSVDIYVSQLETGVAAAKEAEATETERGLTEAERAAERMQYLEENYGWLMDLAEEHNVEVDTKVNLEGIEKDGTGAEVPEESTSKSDAEPELG